MWGIILGLVTTKYNNTPAFKTFPSMANITEIRKKKNSFIHRSQSGKLNGEEHNILPLQCM
jgi:hypothetical protein